MKQPIKCEQCGNTIAYVEGNIDRIQWTALCPPCQGQANRFDRLLREAVAKESARWGLCHKCGRALLGGHSCPLCAYKTTEPRNSDEALKASGEAFSAAQKALVTAINTAIHATQIQEQEAAVLAERKRNIAIIDKIASLGNVEQQQFAREAVRRIRSGE